MCNHYMCQGRSRTAKGVAVCVTDWENNVILLGRERFGRYALRLNVAAGSIEPVDEKCVIRAAMRELKEEFKLELSRNEWLRRARLVFFLGNTPVINLRYNSNEIDVEELNRTIHDHIANPNLPGTYKEMSQLQWVSLEGDTDITSFTRAILKRLRRPNNFVVSKSVSRKEIDAPPPLIEPQTLQTKYQPVPASGSPWARE